VEAPALGVDPDFPVFDAANRDPAFAAWVAVIHRAVWVAPYLLERAEACAHVPQQSVTGADGLPRATAGNAAAAPRVQADVAQHRRVAGEA
jgi:hypothetical protein